MKESVKLMQWSRFNVVTQVECGDQAWISGWFGDRWCADMVVRHRKVVVLLEVMYLNGTDGSPDDQRVSV